MKQSEHCIPYQSRKARKKGVYTEGVSLNFPTT